MEKDIYTLLYNVLKKHEDNKAAAESLGVNPVTFWHWMTKTRKLPSTLCKAIDNAGGKLLFPGESLPASPGLESDLAGLRKEIAYLTKENQLLTRLLDKYIEAEERQKKVEEQGQPSTSDRPASTSFSKDNLDVST